MWWARSVRLTSQTKFTHQDSSPPVLWSRTHTGILSRHFLVYSNFFLSVFLSKTSLLYVFWSQNIRWKQVFHNSSYFNTAVIEIHRHLLMSLVKVSYQLHQKKNISNVTSQQHLLTYADQRAKRLFNKKFSPYIFRHSHPDTVSVFNHY